VDGGEADTDAGSAADRRGERRGCELTAGGAIGTARHHAGL
jgi:hypothetical protein